MKKLNKNTAFTLVELIVVITILAILGTIGFLSFQSYTVYSRDITRLSNLNVLKSGLEIQYTKGGYFAEPDDYVKITASGTVIRKQGLFGKKALRTIKANTDASKDPLTGEYYDYITDDNLSEYQIVGYMEGDETSYKTPLLSKEGLGVVQASGTGYTMKTKGQDLGVVFENSVAVHKVSGNVGTEIDIRTNSENKTYTIKFDEGDEVTSATGSVLFSNVYNRSKALLKNKNLAKLDDSLVLYFDMETTTMSGSTKVLKDLTGGGNHGECYNGNYNLINCGEVGPIFEKNNGVYFSGTNGRIKVNNFNFGNKSISNFAKIKLPKSEENGYVRIFAQPWWSGNAMLRWEGTNRLMVHLYNNSCINEGRGNCGEYEDTKNKLDVNRFFYVGFIYNYKNNDLKLSIQGQPFSYIYNSHGGSTNQLSSGLINRSGDVFIGAKEAGDTRPMYISEIRSYNRALSEKEIKTVYGSTLK